MSNACTPEGRWRPHDDFVEGRTYFEVNWQRVDSVDSMLIRTMVYVGTTSGCGSLQFRENAPLVLPEAVMEEHPLVVGSLSRREAWAYMYSHRDLQLALPFLPDRHPAYGACGVEPSNNRFKISSTKLDQLTAPERVTALDCQGRIDSSAIRELTRFPNLTDLDLRWTLFEEHALPKLLEALPQLRALVLKARSSHEHELRELQSARLLEDLTLEGCALVDEDFGWLAELPKLRRIDLSRSVCDESVFRAIRANPAMQQVILDFTDVTDADVAVLLRRRNLQTLRVFGTGVTDEGIRNLAGNDSLQDLSLGGTQVTLAGCLQTARCPTLRELNLAFTVCDDGVLTALDPLNLDRISLKHTRVSSRGLLDFLGDWPTCSINMFGLG